MTKESFRREMMRELMDRSHPVWKMLFFPAFVGSVFLLQQVTSTSWDLDGEGVALLGTSAIAFALRALKI